MTKTRVGVSDRDRKKKETSLVFSSFFFLNTIPTLCFGHFFEMPKTSSVGIVTLDSHTMVSASSVYR
jgi:hypothetical protein